MKYKKLISNWPLDTPPVDVVYRGYIDWYKEIEYHSFLGWWKP